MTVQKGETIGYYNGTRGRNNRILGRYMREKQQGIITVQEGETIGYYDGTRGRNNRVL